MSPNCLATPSIPPPSSLSATHQTPISAQQLCAKVYPAYHTAQTGATAVGHTPTAAAAKCSCFFKIHQPALCFSYSNQYINSINLKTRRLLESASPAPSLAKIHARSHPKLDLGENPSNSWRVYLAHSDHSMTAKVDLKSPSSTILVSNFLFKKIYINCPWCARTSDLLIPTPVNEPPTSSIWNIGESMRTSSPSSLQNSSIRNTIC